MIETKKDGTVTTTTTDKNGNQTEVVENPDGSSKTTVDNKDGSSSVTTVDEDGKVEAEVKLPATWWKTLRRRASRDPAYARGACHHRPG